MADLEDKTDYELAKMRVEYNDTSPQPILAEQEQQRRSRLHQHELSMEILNTQVRLTKSTLWISAVATISAALLGAIVGAVLQYKLTQQPKQVIQQTTQPLELLSRQPPHSEKIHNKVSSSPSNGK